MISAANVVVLSILCCLTSFSSVPQYEDPSYLKHFEEYTEEDIYVFSFGSEEDKPINDDTHQKGKTFDQTAWSKEAKQEEGGFQSKKDKKQFQTTKDKQQQELEHSWNLENIVEYFLSFFHEQEGSKDILRRPKEENNASYLKNVLKYFLSFVYEIEDDDHEVQPLPKYKTKNIHDKPQGDYSLTNGIKADKSRVETINVHENTIHSFNQSNNGRRLAGPALGSLATYLEQRQVFNWIDEIDDIEEPYIDDDGETYLGLEEDEGADDNILNHSKGLSFRNEDIEGSQDDERRLLEQNVHTSRDLHLLKTNRKHNEMKDKEPGKISVEEKENNAKKIDNTNQKTSDDRSVCYRNRRDEDCKKETPNSIGIKSNVKVKNTETSKTTTILHKRLESKDPHISLHKPEISIAQKISSIKTNEDKLISETTVTPGVSEFADNFLTPGGTDIPTVVATPHQIHKEIKMGSKSQKVFDTILEYIYKNYDNAFFLSLKGNSSSKSSL